MGASRRIKRILQNTMITKFDIKKLGKELKSSRKSRLIGLRSASREMKVPHATIFRIERGEHLDIHVGTLVKICNWMSADPMWYFKQK